MDLAASVSWSLLSVLPTCLCFSWQRRGVSGPAGKKSAFRSSGLSIPNRSPMAVGLCVPDVVRGIPVQWARNEPTCTTCVARRGAGKQYVGGLSSVGRMRDRRRSATAPFLSSQGPKPARLFLTTLQSSPAPLPEFITEQEENDPLPSCPYWKSVCVLCLCCFASRCWAGM